MTNGKFIRECEGLAKALLATAKQAEGAVPEDEMQYDKTAAPIMADDLRNLANEIEKAAK